MKDKILSFLNELITNVKHSRVKCPRRIFFTSFRIHCIENNSQIALLTDSKRFVKNDDGSINVRRIVARFSFAKNNQTLSLLINRQNQFPAEAEYKTHLPS